MLSRADHVKPTIEHDQVVVVRTLRYKFEYSVAAPRQTSEPRRGARMSPPACLATPDAGTGTQSQLVCIDLARVRGPRQWPVSKTCQHGWHNQMQLVRQRLPKVLQEPRHIVGIDAPFLRRL